MIAALLTKGVSFFSSVKGIYPVEIMSSVDTFLRNNTREIYIYIEIVVGTKWGEGSGIHSSRGGGGNNSQRGNPNRKNRVDSVGK